MSKKSDGGFGGSKGRKSKPKNNTKKKTALIDESILSDDISDELDVVAQIGELSDDISYSISRSKNSKSMPFGLEVSLPVIPLRDMVIFPNAVNPLFIGRDKSIAAVEHAMSKDRKIFAVTQKNSTDLEVKSSGLYEFGVVVTIIQCIRLPDDTLKLLVDAETRAEVISYTEDESFLLAKVKTVEALSVNNHETKAIMRNIISSVKEYIKLSKKNDGTFVSMLESISDSSVFCDIACSFLNIDYKTKQGMLEMRDVTKRLDAIYLYVVNESEILKAEKNIQERVRSQMDKSHKEYYLNEQIKAIKKELGDKDGNTESIERYEALMASKNLSKEAQEKAKEEIKRLSTTSASSSEHIRSYLDWLFSMPWNEFSDNSEVNIMKAQAILNRTHYGLDKVKSIILEYVAVQMNTKRSKSSILCLYGPPGVGKTSLVRSIAESMGKKYVKIALGGVRDEAEIRGHRRTYVGALPGKIIQAMKKAGTSDPVILLDEIDKMNSDYKGDPSSALLEALDPEQNKEFNDHFLEVGYDLSNVMFIATANSLNMQRPLLDRLEIVKVPSYLENDKLEICKQHIVRKQLNLVGLPEDCISFSDEAITDIIRHYTRESGVRELSRLVAKISRKSLINFMNEGSIKSFSRDVKVKKTADKDNKDFVVPAAKMKKDFTPVIIDKTKIHDLLGVHKYSDDDIEKKDKIAVTNGLAYTEVGGSVLLIEAVKIEGGKGEVKITGKLGDVMKESAQAAMSYVSANAKRFGIKVKDINSYNIHIHAPEGAVPKDGPSAGVTIATTLVSLFTSVPVRHDVAMTGEITLRGRVTAIGGLREKMVAAISHGIKTILIPKDNKKDLEEVPDYVKQACEVILCESIDDVIKVSFRDPIIKQEEDYIAPINVITDTVDNGKSPTIN